MTTPAPAAPAPKLDWMENHELAKQMFELGHKFEAIVAARLRAEGITTTSPQAKAIRKSVAEARAGKFTNEVDLVANGLRLSVKSRDRMFTDDPASFPFPTVFVDQVYKWKQKEPKPFAVICVSQQAAAARPFAQPQPHDYGMIWLHVADTAPMWRAELGHYDTKRNATADRWAAARELWRPWSSLAEAITTAHDGVWWLSTAILTGGVTVRRGFVTDEDCTPILRKFVGQPFPNLVRWLRAQPGLRSERTPFAAPAPAPAAPLPAATEPEAAP